MLHSVVVLAFADLPPPTLVGLMNIVGVDLQADWENVGLGLGLEQATLDAIRCDFGGDVSSCMKRVFTQWYESGACEYSWRTLAEVLSSKLVNKAGLLPDMLDKAEKQQ